jgi:hypothetical protein
VLGDPEAAVAQRVARWASSVTPARASAALSPARIGARSRIEKGTLTFRKLAGTVVARLRAMCAQCMATATVAAAGATGVRAWLATRGWAWLTPGRLRRATVALLIAGVAGAGTLSGLG